MLLRLFAFWANLLAAFSTTLMDTNNGVRLSVLDSSGKKLHSAEMGKKLKIDIRISDNDSEDLMTGNNTILPRWCKISSEPAHNSKIESMIPFVQAGCPLDLLPVVVQYPKRIASTHYTTPFSTFVFSSLSNYIYIHCEIMLCRPDISQDCNKDCWDRIPVPKKKVPDGLMDGTVEAVGNNEKLILSSALKVFEDPCQDSPCQNNGTCISEEGSESYRCECRDNWVGPDCNYSACQLVIQNKGAYILWTEFYNNRNEIDHRYVGYGNSILVPSIAGGRILTGAVWGRSYSCFLTNNLCAKPVWVTCHGTTILGFNCTCQN